MQGSTQKKPTSRSRITDAARPQAQPTQTATSDGRGLSGGGGGAHGRGFHDEDSEIRGGNNPSHQNRSRRPAPWIPPPSTKLP